MFGRSLEEEPQLRNAKKRLAIVNEDLSESVCDPQASEIILLKASQSLKVDDHRHGGSAARTMHCPADLLGSVESKS